MHFDLRTIIHITLLAIFAASHPDTGKATDSALATAQSDYLAAINANDPDRLIETVTPDVVFIAPNAPGLEGRVQLRAWARRHFKAVATSFEKTPKDVVIAGNWAFETYTYRAVDTPHNVGPAMIEIGNGLSVYHLKNDGWRVARDLWAIHERWAIFDDGCAVTRPVASPC